MSFLIRIPFRLSSEGDFPTPHFILSVSKEFFKIKLYFLSAGRIAPKEFAKGEFFERTAQSRRSFLALNSSGYHSLDDLLAECEVEDYDRRHSDKHRRHQLRIVRTELTRELPHGKRKRRPAAVAL